MTPSALRFCQMAWDESCDRTLAEIGKHAIEKPPPICILKNFLGEKRARFWYEWNKPLKPKQREFPKKSQPFDRYLDMYRDPREIARTVQRERLERRVREGEVRPAAYPDVFYGENKRSMEPWQHARLMERNTGRGIYARLYADFKNPGLRPPS